MKSDNRLRTCALRNVRYTATVGLRNVIRHHAPKGQDFTNRNASLSALERERPAPELHQSKVRMKGEQLLLILKHVFGFAKVRYRGKYKNAN